MLRTQVVSMFPLDTGATNCSRVGLRGSKRCSTKAACSSKFVREIMATLQTNSEKRNIQREEFKRILKSSVGRIIKK